MTTYATPGQPAERDDAMSAGGLHEGLRAGLVAATSVWSWMFVDDLFSGVPLRTPTMLGRGLLSLVASDVVAPVWVASVVFTVVHYALWIGVGALVIRVVYVARRTPSALVGAVFGLILLQLVTTVVLAIASHSRLGTQAWTSLGFGHVVGWTALLWYVVRRHRELRGEFAHSEDDDD
jgi:hypothetical protein